MPLLQPSKQSPLTKARDTHNLVVGFSGVHLLEGADAVAVIQLSGHGDEEKKAEKEEDRLDDEEVGFEGDGLGAHCDG